MSKFPKANTSTEKRAKSVEEAISEALNELGIKESEAEIEVVQAPSKGLFGIGAKEAVVKVSVKEAKAQTTEKADEEPEKVEEVKVVKEEKKAAEPKKEKSADLVYNSESPAENAKNFITDVLKAMGLEVSVSAAMEEDIIKINLEGDNMGIVIGKRGDTLDSLQYLTSLVVNRNSDDYIKVSIDTENYREKRSEALIVLSDRLAAKVARTGKKFALEPMNPYERRIIHSNLQDNEDVTTFSVGQEPYRKVVIAPKNPKPYNSKRSYNKGYGNKNAVKGGYNNQSYENDNQEDTAETSVATYKADFKPQQHKAEFKNFEEYLAAHSKD